MTATQQNFPGMGLSLDERIDQAVKTLQLYQPKDAPYYGCFSGGKDSVVIKHLSGRAGVNVEWWYNNTTIDPPELVRFIKRKHPDVQWNKPKHGNFFKRMEKKGFPTRRQRWCCEEYKESVSPRDRRLILGVRAAESPRRAATWKVVTYHRKTKTNAISPIVYWTDANVWEYIRREGVEYCELYDEGFKRLGCIGCPMAREAGRRREFERWPRYEKLWKRAFKRIWEKRAGKPQRDGREWFGSARFENWEQMWEWWLSNDPLPGGEDCQGFLDLVS